MDHRILHMEPIRFHLPNQREAEAKGEDGKWTVGFVGLVACDIGTPVVVFEEIRDGEVTIEGVVVTEQRHCDKIT